MTLANDAKALFRSILHALHVNELLNLSFDNKKRVCFRCHFLEYKIVLKNYITCLSQVMFVLVLANQVKSNIKNVENNRNYRFYHKAKNQCKKNKF